MTDLSKLAEGLTPAMRRMVLTDDSGFADHAKGKWHALHSASSKRLHALGLIESPDTLAVPTALGLALKAHLQSEGEV